MFDSTQRNIHYLRLSVTVLCTLRCRYCMPDGVEKLEREAVLTYEEFLRLAALFARCGVDTVRVTGGEPLVRKGVDQLVAGLKSIPGIRKVTMTTNGILLAQQLPALLEAGLDSVNIILDTLRPEVFQSITARDEFEHVMEGIRAALDSGIPVKLNCVPQVGVNEGELEALAALAQDKPLQVRFIEMMPIGFGAAQPGLSGPEVLARLKTLQHDTLFVWGEDDKVRPMEEYARNYFGIPPHAQELRCMGTGSGMANGVARRQDDVHHEAADADRRHADQQSGVDQDIRSQPVFHASGT